MNPAAMNPAAMNPAAMNPTGSPTVEVRTDRPANGGDAVGRVDGRVVFVRGAIPGERVRARITDDSASGFWRAEAIEILEPSPHRVDEVCPAAAQGAGCCDLGFVDLAYSRELKSQVLSDALVRIGHLDPADLEAAGLGAAGLGADVPGGAVTSLGDDGTRWRIRTRLGVDATGRAGQHARHGARIVAGYPCAAPEPALLLGLDDIEFTPGADVAAVADADGHRHLVELAPARPAGRARGRRGRAQSVRRHREAPRAERVVEGDAVAAHRVGGRVWRIPVAGFWQAHRAAPTVYARTVVAMLAAAGVSGASTAWDLYGGAGVFAAALLDEPGLLGGGEDGRGGGVHVVESDARSLAAAAETFDGDDRIALHRAEVSSVLTDLPAPDVVVLDPPRTGAGAAVIEKIAAADPGVVVHVGCDVGRFARDLALFADHGYRLREIRGFDAFPHTHHVEAIACLVPANVTPR